MESMTVNSIEFIPQVKNLAGSSGSLRGRPRGPTACDRCREQKLRCTLEEQSANANSESRKCLRCKTVRAICSFGTTKRTGRLPEAPRKRRKSRNHDQSTSSSTEDNRSGPHCRKQKQSREHGDALLSGNDREAEAGQTVLAERFAVNSVPSVLESIPDALGTPNEELFTMPAFCGDAGLLWDEEFDTRIFDTIDPADLQPRFHASDWPFQRHQREIDKSQRPTNSAAWNGHLTQHTSLSDNEIFPDLRLGNGQVSAFPGITFGHTSNRPTLDSKMASTKDQEKIRPGIFSIDFTPDTTSNGDALEAESWTTTQTSPSALSGKDIQCRRLQELSQLGTILYSQVLTTEATGHQATITEPPSSYNNEIVAKILQSSASFLSLLESFYPSTTQPLEGNPLLALGNGDGSMSVEATRLSDNAAESADMATILQLLSCYICLIDLYDILYGRIIVSLTTLPQHSHARLLSPICSNVQVGGVPLDKFRTTFQAKLVLQLSAQILGEIETALGVPDGYRIGDEHPQGHGILGTCASSQFVEMALREYRQRDVPGFTGDRFQRVRNHLVTLRQLTKGTAKV